MRVRGIFGIVMPKTPKIACLAALLAALTCSAFRADAASPGRRLEWDNLAPAVLGKTVMVAMPEGTVITGTATGVTPDALLVDVRSTTDAKAYPRGPARVPRATLRNFQLRTKGKVFRILGTSAGSLAGLTGGALANFGSRSKGHLGRSLAVLFGVWAAGTAGGYFVGNAADKRWTPVQVVP